MQIQAYVVTRGMAKERDAVCSCSVDRVRASEGTGFRTYLHTADLAPDPRSDRPSHKNDSTYLPLSLFPFLYMRTICLDVIQILHPICIWNDNKKNCCKKSVTKITQYRAAFICFNETRLIHCDYIQTAYMCFRIHQDSRKLMNRVCTVFFFYIVRGKFVSPFHEFLHSISLNSA